MLSFFWRQGESQMIEFGLKFSLVFSCPLLAQGSPLAEFTGSHKVYKTEYSRVGQSLDVLE